jgi:hypothetical protein
MRSSRRLHAAAHAVVLGAALDAGLEGEAAGGMDMKEHVQERHLGR